MKLQINDCKVEKPENAKMDRLARLVMQLEAIIHKDPGSRGIAHITLQGQLLAAARSLACAKRVSKYKTS